MEDTGSTDYFGHIVSDAKACIVSFPGKYQSGWEALIDENASHKHSVGCVFLCTPESGLGKHAQDPDAAEGVCYCPKIYGNKDYNKLGYLKLLRKGTTKDEEKQQRLNAECTKAVVIRENAREEDLHLAKQKAEEAWIENGKRASWGCACLRSGRRM